MLKAMSFTEFFELVEYIKKNNAPLGQASMAGLPSVKYIDPHFDMRTNEVFSVTFRTFGCGYQFYVMNEFRECKVSLKERIMLWLNTKRDDHDSIKHLYVVVDSNGNRIQE